MISDRPADEAAPLLAGLAEEFQGEIENSPDPFAEGRILGVFIGQLLNLSQYSLAATRYMHDMIARAHAADVSAAHRLRRELAINKYCLLSHDGLADLYYLSVRVLDILSRIGTILLHQTIDHQDVEFFGEIVDEILNFYANSILAVTDEQGAAVVFFVRMLSPWMDFESRNRARIIVL